MRFATVGAPLSGGAPLGNGTPSLPASAAFEAERAGQPVDLVDNHDVDPPCRDVGEQPLRSRPIYRRAENPPSS